MDTHDDVIKRKHLPRYWPFVRGIHRSPVNSPQKGQWCGVLMLFFICAWINGWVNNREAGDLRGHRAHYDVIVMYLSSACHNKPWQNVNCMHTYAYLVRYVISPHCFNSSRCLASPLCLLMSWSSQAQIYTVVFLGRLWNLQTVPTNDIAQSRWWWFCWVQIKKTSINQTSTCLSQPLNHLYDPATPQGCLILITISKPIDAD